MFQEKQVPTSVTLNGIAAVILCFFTEFIALQADYVIVVEDVRKILSPSPILPFWPKLTHPAAWSLCKS